MMDKFVKEFRECVSTVSYCRAGWDYYDMSPYQKAREAESARINKQRAQELYRDHPELREAFLEQVRGSLMTADEITRVLETGK